MTNKKNIFLLFGAIILSLPIAATNGMFPIFMGIPGAGRAGVDIGIASDATCINTNPGGLGFLYGKTMEFSAGAYFPSISFENATNKSESYFEPIAIGSAAFAWDHLNQTGEIFLDPWRYIFCGTPRNSEYIYFSNNQPLATENSQNTGIGKMEFSLPENIENLELNVTGNDIVLQGVRVVIPQKSLSKIFFATNMLPALPPQAQITTVAAHFTWRGTGNSQIKIEVDEISEKVILNKNNQNPIDPNTNLGYIALAWSKPYSPCLIRISSDQSDSLEIQLTEILLGYRLAGEIYWEKIPLNYHSNKDVGMIAALDVQEYSIQNTKPLRLMLASFFKNISSQKIKLFYSYKMQPSARLELLASIPNRILARNLHGGIQREADKPVPICQRNADHETPMNVRASGWKFGFGVFPQAGARYTVKVKTDDFFQEGVENRTDIMVVSVAPSVAYRFGDRFSIGVSLNLNWESLELDGLISQSSLILKGTPFENTQTTFGQYLVATRDINNIKGELDTNALYGFGVGGRLGFLWKINKNMQLGAMYSPKTWMMDATGKVTLDFNRHFNDIDVAHIVKIVLPNNGREGFSGKYDMKIDFEMPQQAGVGFSWLLGDNLLLSADFRWINYSDTQYVIKAKVKNGTNADLNALIGANGTTASIPVGWKDQYIAAIGLVWQSSPNWIWRMGYNYSSGIVPDEYLNPQLAAITEHHVTLGASYVINRNLTVSTAIEAGLPNSLKSGNTNYVHEKFANSELELFTISALMGVSMRF